MIYVPSQNQIKQLFSIGNLSAAEFQSSSELLLYMCGTLKIQYLQGNKTIAAYIIKEYHNTLHIQTASNAVGTVTTLIFSDATQSYLFPMNEKVINCTLCCTLKTKYSCMYVCIKQIMLVPRLFI